MPARRLLDMLNCKKPLTNADIHEEQNKAVNVGLAAGLFAGTIVVLFLLVLLYHCIFLLRYKRQGKDHLWDEMIARSDAKQRQREAAKAGVEAEQQQQPAPAMSEDMLPASPVILRGPTAFRGEKPSINTQASQDTEVTTLGSPTSPRTTYSFPPPSSPRYDDTGRAIPATCHI